MLAPMVRVAARSTSDGPPVAPAVARSAAPKAALQKVLTSLEVPWSLTHACCCRTRSDTPPQR